MFEQRLSDALRNTAVHLTFDDHRIDDRAEVIDRGPRLDLRLAGLRVDLEFADMATRREREVGGVVERALLQARLDLAGGELVRDVGLQCEIGEAD